MVISPDEAVLRAAEEGITAYLEDQHRHGKIDQGLFDKALRNVIANMTTWLGDDNIDRLSPNLKDGIRDAVGEERWAVLTEVFVDEIAFGTAGIRGKAAMTDPELRRLNDEGIDARILKGPNTLNNIVLLLKSAGVARYAVAMGLQSVVIGFDSRVQGQEFAHLIARLFLANGLKIFLFDEACPYPEMVFGISHLKADLGILVSASHNDRRYNGYKLSAGTGSQFEPAERKVIYEDYIRKMTTSDIRLIELSEAGSSASDPQDPFDTNNKLVYLGGDSPLDGVDYHSRPLIDLHKIHLDQVKRFIIDKPMVSAWAATVPIGYCAYHGAGRKAIPRLLKDFGFEDLQIITDSDLNELNGLFPAFQDDPEQQPDPGDAVAAEIAAAAFQRQFGEDEFNRQDIVIGTDPDADRVGLTIKVPEEQREAYGGKSHVLLDADDAWTLLLWYRFFRESNSNAGKLRDGDKKFIVLSHITTDALVRLGRKYGVGVVKTWVGFAMIANAIQKVWSGHNLDDPEFKDLICTTIDMAGRNINAGALEQSNGFSILGGPPVSHGGLGNGGHTRDKDGTFAAILLAEVAAYARSENKTLMDLLDEHIYLDPEIGYFLTYFEPSPQWGEYKGLEGWTAKINILRACVGLHDAFQAGQPLSFGGVAVKSSEVFVVGKYAEVHQWPDFPDEGIRFYFDDAKWSYLTVRPSGTSQCLRFHLQLKAEDVDANNLISKKKEANSLARSIVSDIRSKVNAGD
jgi:phosphoglucomutase